MPTWPLQNTKNRSSEWVKLSLIDTLLQAPRGEPLELERSPEPIRDVDLRNNRSTPDIGIAALLGKGTQ